MDYDPAGMLRRVTAGGTVTSYLYDGADLVATYDGSGNLLQRFVHGGGFDQPLVVYDAAGTRHGCTLTSGARSTGPKKAGR